MYFETAMYDWATGSLEKSAIINSLLEKKLQNDK
jgi:hypothetical protein